MARREALMLLLAAVAILIGILVSILPKTWIEDVIGIEPDGGSGLLELIFVAVPIAVGVALAALALPAGRRLWHLPGKVRGGTAERR